jgi:hypothetical protein
MPDQIDLEPHEFRRDGETRTAVVGAIFFAVFTLFGLWVSGWFFDWHGWAVAFFGLATGFSAAFASPSAMVG